MQKFAKDAEIKRKFIVSFFLWMRNVYESLMGMVKPSLKKEIQRKPLTAT